MNTLRTLPPGIYTKTITVGGKPEVRYRIDVRHKAPGKPSQKLTRWRGRGWGMYPEKPLTTLAMAKKERAAIVAELDAGTYFDQLAAWEATKTPAEAIGGPLTVGEWLDRWLDGLRLSPSTMASYRKNVRLHLKPNLGALPLADLTGADLTAAYKQLEESGRSDGKDGGLSPRTVRYVHTIIKSALREAVAEGLIPANPGDRAKPPSAREARAPEVHAWTGPQLDQFLTYCRDHGSPDTAAFWVLACTGMRRGELLALQWRDIAGIDWNQDAVGPRVTVSVRRSASLVKEHGDGHRLVVGPTKTGHDRRVDLDALTVEVIRQWRKERKALKQLALLRDEAYVFGTVENAVQYPDHFSRRFVDKQKQLVRSLRKGDVDAEFPQIRLHDLRHTHATLLLMAGAPVKVVSERLGHASTTITQEVYQHVMPGMQAQVADMFIATFKGGN